MRLFTFFTKISRTAYLVALISLLIRTGFFMTLPFLAVYLTQQGILTPSEIGIVIGVSGLTFSLTGLFNGMYVDRHSARNVLITVILLSGLCYFALAFSMKLFFALALTNAALGWFRSLSDISALAIMISATPKENLGYAYSIRFMAINLGLVVGPLIGAEMARQQSLLIFYIAGTIHLVVGICLLRLKKQKIVPQEPIRIFQHFHEIWKNKLLINITLINLLMWIAYSQMDSTIPQYIAHTEQDPALLVSKIMIINAIICVLFQPIIMRWAEETSLKISGIIGALLFSATFIMIGIYPSHLTMLIAAGLLSIGELFTLPINGVLVMRNAPSHLVSSYNGFANLGLLGLSIGPIIGGYGLQFLGGKQVFLLIALFPLIVVWRYGVCVPHKYQVSTSSVVA